MKQKEYIVLIDSEGRVARSFKIDQNSFFIVQRKDSRRVELVTDLEELEKNNVPYKLISQSSKIQLKAQPVSLGRHGKIQVMDHLPAFAPTVTLKDEHSNAFKPILRWTAMAHMFVLLFFLIGNLVIQKWVIEEPRVVTVVKQQVKKKRIQTVKASKKKVNRRKVVRKKPRVKKKVVKNSHRTVRSKTKKAKRRYRTPVRRTVKVDNMGALGALKGLAGAPNKKGVNLGRVSGRKGMTGAKGKGSGHRRALYGKALAASAPGRGTKVAGVGSYKTRGAGGGRQGYGKISMAGSSDAYLYPLEEEALIDGGLERDQIAAVIQRHLGQVVYCYEKGLQVNPRLAGRVAVQFVIAPNGRVSTAKVANTSLRSKKVNGCIVSRLRTWKFPKPYGQVSVNVTYPFVLRRVGAAQSVSQR